MNPTATEAYPPATTRSTTSRAACSSRASSTSPEALIRSGTTKRSLRSIRGAGSTMLRSYCSKRLSVRVSITSRNPAVVTSAVLGRPALYQRVGGQGGAVDDLRDLLHGHALAAGDGRDSRQDPFLGPFVGGQHLRGREGTVGAFQCDVGEGAPHVYPDPGSDRGPLPRLQILDRRASGPAGTAVLTPGRGSLHGYRSSTAGKVAGGTMSTVAERCWASIPPSTRSVSPVM